jgi:hypothetical protein
MIGWILASPVFRSACSKIIIGGISGICDFRRIPINVKYLECKISEVVTKKVEYLEYFFRIDSLSCVIYPEWKISDAITADWICIKVEFLKYVFRLYSLSCVIYLGWKISEVITAYYFLRDIPGMKNLGSNHCLLFLAWYTRNDKFRMQSLLIVNELYELL